MSQRKRYLLIALLFVFGAGLRWRVVGEFHAPAGDGHEYHHLAHELKRADRYAYGPHMPLSYGRMPGYPLLLTLIEPQTANDIETLLVRGTHLNVLLDVITALFVLGIALEAGFSRRRAWLACALVFACPLLILDCCYLLRETFTTTLTMATMYFIVRSLRRRTALDLMVAGALAGAAMLVRFDAVAVAVAFIPPLVAIRNWWGWRGRTSAALGALLATALVFSPWMIRNQVQFGAPHPWGATWPDANGRPNPTGIFEWMRTWIDGLHEGWLNFRITTHNTIGERDINADPAAFDYTNLAEKQELLELFAIYNREGGMSPHVDQLFHELAMRRIRERPVRMLIWLPVRRAFLWWWNFTRAEEQPLRSKTLLQPQGRWMFEVTSYLFFVFGIAGCVLLVRAPETRAFGWTVMITLFFRTLLMAYASPDGCQRYLAPVYPLMLIAVAYVPDELKRFVQARRNIAETSSQSEVATN